MRKIFQSIVLLGLYLVFITNIILAQNIDGDYREGTSNSVLIKNDNFILTKSIYEFYGQPPAVYSYRYKIRWIDKEHIRLKLRRAKIIDGAKNSKGQLRLWARNRNPKYNGSYLIEIENDNIKLTEEDSNKTILLKKKSI